MTKPQLTIALLKREIALTQGKYKNLRTMKAGAPRDALLAQYTAIVTKHSKAVLKLGGKLDKFQG